MNVSSLVTMQSAVPEPRTALPHSEERFTPRATCLFTPQQFSPTWQELDSAALGDHRRREADVTMRGLPLFRNRCFSKMLHRVGQEGIRPETGQRRGLRWEALSEIPASFR